MEGIITKIETLENIDNLNYRLKRLNQIERREKRFKLRKENSVRGIAAFIIHGISGQTKKDIRAKRRDEFCFPIELK